MAPKYARKGESWMNVRLTDLMRGWLKKKAQENDRSMAYVVRELIQNQMDAEGVSEGDEE